MRKTAVISRNKFIACLFLNSNFFRVSGSAASIFIGRNAHEALILNVSLCWSACKPTLAEHSCRCLLVFRFSLQKPPGKQWSTSCQAGRMQADWVLHPCLSWWESVGWQYNDEKHRLVKKQFGIWSADCLESSTEPEMGRSSCSSQTTDVNQSCYARNLEMLWQWMMCTI